MKKILKIIMALMCCIALVGCGEVSTQNKFKNVSNLYETEELSIENLGDIEFQIPKIFKNDTSENREWIYHYYNDLLFAESCKEENNFTNESFSGNSDSYINGMIQNNDGKILNVEIIELEIGKAIKSSIEETVNEKRYILHSIAFIYNKNIYNIGFMNEKTSNVDYSKDFEKLIQTITIKDDYAKEKIEIETETVEVKTEEEKTKENNPTSSTTIGQRNALRSAKNYLSMMAFSYSGLVEQLEFEQYSHDDAVYAADNCGADWNKQAAKSAKNYLEMMPFSREELISQLEFEGFSHEEAVYGAEANGY